MIKIVIPFSFSNSKTQTSCSGDAYFFINNEYIVKQEVKLHSGVIGSRYGKSLLKETDGYKTHSKHSLRDDLLGEYEFIPKDDKAIQHKVITLDNSQLKEISETVSKSGTILSTLYGIFNYVNASGSQADVRKSFLKINKGKYKDYRFYNLFNYEFIHSKQAEGKINEFEEYSIDEYLEKDRKFRFMFALYNFDKDNEFLRESGIVLDRKAYSYDELLGKASKQINRTEKKYIIDLYRQQFSKAVSEKYENDYDFVYRDTKSWNAEKAHIYEVHSIKQLQSENEWNMIKDPENCLLLTPSIHKAWDKKQIKILDDGSIINISMEEKRFKRLFSITNYKISVSLSSKQKEYLTLRYSS